MAVRWGRQVVLWCVIAGLVTSCGEHQEEAELYHPVGWIPPGHVPPALEAISNTAVNVIDAAGMEDWPRVYADVQDISDRWSDYKHPTVVPSSYPRPAAALLYGNLDVALSRLKEAAAARRSAETMWAANNVDAAAIELIAFYHPYTPIDLHRLAVLERKVLLYAWRGDLAPASDTLLEVHRTWSRVRPIVVDRSGLRVAETFDASLADQQAALDANEIIRLGNYAGTNLILIHEMEQVSY